MAFSIIQFVFILFFPFFTIFLVKRIRTLRWVSPIILCYVTGIIIGNIGVEGLNTAMILNISQISVCLAIPALLFSSDFKQWIRHSRVTFLSFFLASAAVVISSVFAYFLFRSRIPEASKYAGMLIGVYTGGTPNMTAIGLALDARESDFILLNSADIFFCGIYFVLLISVAKKFLGLFLPPFKFSDDHDTNKNKTIDFIKLPLNNRIILVLLSILLSAVIFTIALSISFLIRGKIVTPLVILTLTTLSIFSSFSRRIHSIRGTYETAEYLLLIFAIAIGSQANFSELIERSSLIFAFCGTVVVCSILLHVLFSIIFRIDTDTLIITSTAALFGPAFIGPVANGIRNRQIIISGIAMGLLGYAIGNYLGVAVGLLLK